MSSRFLEASILALLAAQATAAPPVDAEAAPAPLRVCLDPDNLPYSNQDGRGFDVLIAGIVADALHQPLELHWQPLRRGYVRKSLGEHVCDVLMDIPTGMDRVATTSPYYRSTFVFVSRRGDARAVTGFDDAGLADKRIAVQLIGQDLAATPPGQALARRGATQHVMGLTVDGGDGSIGERLVQAIVHGDVDTAVAWGPQVGWFASRAPQAMSVTRAMAPPGSQVPFEFPISLAVRPDDGALRDRLQAALAARRSDVQAALLAYAVPMLDEAGPASRP